MKTITRHPAVDEVESGEWGGDKKYFVHLKRDFWFQSHETGSKSFDTVAEFLATTIERRPETMEIRHIKKRIFTSATVGVTTLCGARVGKKAWYAQDARNLLRLVVKCNIPAIRYGESWKFCPDCVEKI